MNKKQIGRCCAFLLVVCFVLFLLSDLFELENDTNYDKRFNTYRDLTSDIVDAVIIGTSGVDRYYISAKAYEEQGLSIYNLSSDAMPSWLYKNVIEYACEHQTPELFIIDARAFTQCNDVPEEVDSRGRRVIDSMNFFSLARFKAAFKSMEVSHKVSEENPRFDLSYVLPFIKFHGKWEEDDYYFKKNLGNKEHKYGSFYVNSERTIKIKESEPVVRDENLYIDLDPIAEESLYDLIDYIKDKNLNVLFLETPKFETEEEMGRSNNVRKILDEHEMKYVNYCETDANGNFKYASNLDLKTDFYNVGHVNYYGAEKFTPIFAEYLRENYDLPDRSDDENAHAYWDGIYSHIKEAIAKMEKEQKEAALQETAQQNP